MLRSTPAEDDDWTPARGWKRLVIRAGIRSIIGTAVGAPVGLCVARKLEGIAGLAGRTICLAVTIMLAGLAFAAGEPAVAIRGGDTLGLVCLRLALLFWSGATCPVALLYWRAGAHRRRCPRGLIRPAR